ncbi:MAG: hypothetical protein H7Y38_07240 [Armatimonadetes bacterium]|nr:hypothetical protein [Armatimonadota bacterium]
MGRSQDADDCRQWVRTLTRSGVAVYVPEIADYEIRRELVRAKNPAAVARLDLFNREEPYRYVPINTRAMVRAADLWATLRNSGVPTAPPDSIDGDVILSARMLNFCTEQGIAPTDVCVASANVRHLSRMVIAQTWAQITPPATTAPGSAAA